MIEKFIPKTYFYEKLHLSEVSERQIVEYHMQKHDITDVHAASRHLLDTYSDLLKIARTLYYPEEKLEELNLEDIGFTPLELGDMPDSYIVRYLPKSLDYYVWMHLYDAFAESGYLKPFPNERRLMILPELDYCFSSILKEYSDMDSYSMDLKAIGCLCPDSHDAYEAFNTQLTFNTISRLMRYFTAMSIPITNILDDFIGADPDRISGKMAARILDNKVLCRVLGRTDVMRAINDIYLDRPIIITI